MHVYVRVCWYSGQSSYPLILTCKLSTLLCTLSLLWSWPRRLTFHKPGPRYALGWCNTLCGIFCSFRLIVLLWNEACVDCCVRCFIDKQNRNNSWTERIHTVCKRDNPHKAVSSSHLWSFPSIADLHYWVKRANISEFLSMAYLQTLQTKICKLAGVLSDESWLVFLI